MPKAKNKEGSSDDSLLPSLQIIYKGTKKITTNLLLKASDYYGTPLGIRTLDTLIKSQVLYRLS